MKLLEVYPLTIVGLRAWPNPKGKKHSGVEQVDVDGPHSKIKLKTGKKKVPLFNKLGEGKQTAAEKYGIKVGQVYEPADGTKGHTLTVKDVDKYAHCDDVIVADSASNKERRIDAFKLAMVRYSLKENELVEGADPKTIDVDTVHPDKKDVERAEGLQFRGSTFHGDNSPWASEAAKMSKLIKDPLKLVRRAKAVAQMYGTTKYDPYDGRHSTPDQKKDVWIPFANALEKMGFSREQIKKIEGSKPVKEDYSLKKIAVMEGWHNHRDGSFTADIADIDAYQKGTKQEVRCPKCRKPLSINSLSKKRDGEGEITNWKGTHSCGAKLTVFND